MSRPPNTTTRRALALVVCLLLSTVVVSAAAPASVESVEFAGDGVVATDNNVTYLAAWQTQTVRVGLSGGDGSTEVCAQLGTGNGAQQLACESASGSDSLTLRITDWGGATGEQQFAVVATNDSGATNSVTRTVHVLAAGGDVDGDGLSNRAETEVGTNILTADSDGDGLSDGNEVNVRDTNATNPDTDDDGIADGAEVSDGNGYETDPTNADTDGDGIPDGREQNSLGTNPAKKDTDDDGIEDGEEIVNGSDGYITDPTAADSDEDGLSDGAEVNQYDTDPTAADTDDDGIADGAELSGENGYETDPTDPDTDGDGLTDGEEINQWGTNPLVSDTDGDGVSDGVEVERGSDPAPDSSQRLDVDGVPMVAGVLVAYALLVGAIVWVGRGSEEGGIEPAPAPTDGGDAGGDGEAVTVAPEPMTNEDRIRQMLDANEGRVRQADIVEQTDWSKSKVSRLLSKMESDGEIRKISIGRENLIARPGDEPESARSPFEEHD